MKTILQTTLFIILFSTNLKAQNIDATLLEINFSGDSNPKNITKGNTNIYFSADDGIHGRELWVYNSITNSSTMVKDIFIDSQSGLEYSYFVTINDQLYFTANDGTNGYELWTSDGTETGTFLIKDINNIGESNIGKLKVFNNNIYFSANDNVNGQELWRSDGTTNGTTILKDINFGNNSSSPTDFFVFNDNLFFICNNGINGVELWKSDGTNSGTILLKDINSSSNSSINSGNNFIIFNNNFYFFANNGTTGFELWKSDGTTFGTQLLKEIYHGANSSSFLMRGCVTSNYFVFEARNSIVGNELWKSDGTSTGTVLLKDINSTYDGLYLSDFVKYNNIVYFTADNGINGEELWTTDGTTNGTQLVKDINIGINSSNISKLTSTNNFIIFSATDSSTSYNTLWKSDGTLNGTSQISNINLSQFSNTDLSFVELNNFVYFQGGYDSLNGIELCKTDGTINNTFIVSDIFHKYANSFGNKDFIAFNNKLIFAGTDGIHGSEPFITDGTIGGTKMIKDINPNYSSIYNDYDYIPSFTKAGNNVFFRATNGTNGFEIFKTDGTELGTSMVKDIAQGNASSIGEFTLFMEYNGIFYFKANNQINGEVLWRTDGTDLGTYILKNIYPYGSNLYQNHDNIINQKYYSVLNGFLYFTANDGTGYAIWKTDGTAEGTVKVITVLSNQGTVSVPLIINTSSNKLFFTTNIDNSSYGNNSLWSTDGTQAGTILLGSWLITGPVQFKKNIIFNNELFFTVYSENGPTLMKSNGSQTGTIALTNPNFTNYYTFNSLKACGNFVYFSTGESGAIVGKELWRTDGTNNGTVLIEEIPLGTPNYFADCTCIQNNLFFIKEFYSDKIWYVNNNLQTTNFFQINILNSNNFLNYYGVSDITNLNNNLLFDGVSQESGQELYYSNIQNLLNNKDYTNENTRFDKIKVYPNPSNGNINLFISDNSKLTDINIYNTLGENLFNLKTENLTSIDLSRFNSGIYFIKISTENYSETKKIVIK